MKKVLWLSDSPMMNTGYSTISRNVLNGISDEYQTFFLGHNYPGQTLPPGLCLQDGFRFKFSVLGVGREQYGLDTIMPRLQKMKADIFVILLDTFMVYPRLLDLNFAPARSIFYFPSDGGGGIPQDCEKILRHVDLPVAMSRFAQQQVKENYNIDAEYIPHAVDHNNYRPFSQQEKDQSRREFETVDINGALTKGFLSGKFVVGTVARNQGRKMLDNTVKAFSLFCKDKPDAVLFFHSDMFDGAAVFDLRVLIQRHHLENRVCFSNIKYYENFEYTEMSKVYNVMDVFFLSTSGEGFGIPTVEAMSCEIPCAVTDYTTTRELLIDDGVCGIPIKIAAELTGNWVVERAIMDVHDGARALSTYYFAPQLRVMHGKKGREKVLDYYTWDIVLPQWKNLFKRIAP